MKKILLIINNDINFMHIKKDYDIRTVSVKEFKDFIDATGLHN